VQIETELRFTQKALRAASKDVLKTAKAVSLIYVNNAEPGILRKRKGEDFFYTEGKKRISSKAILTRIHHLVIPPAWENVWICKDENGHLQATGIDKLGRKQYRYHPSWSKIRNQTKFYRMVEFGKKLPAIRSQVQKDLSLTGFPKEKILATLVSLLEHTHIRIGNSSYEKLYHSFGLTTLKNYHVEVKGTQVIFAFKGKKGIHHEIGLRSKRLARIIKGCQEIPGKELFEYIDESDNVHRIDSGMVNEYIRTISEDSFSAKDFRTWGGTRAAILAFKETPDFETITERNKLINAVYDKVALSLGNTRMVCKKYYVHPILEKLYSEKKLNKYLSTPGSDVNETNDLIDSDEIILLNILAREH